MSPRTGSNDATRSVGRKGNRMTPAKPRGRGLRTRTGCSTCRRRHIKCDEARPVCRACARVGRTCVYQDVRPSNIISETRQEPLSASSLTSEVQLAETQSAPGSESASENHHLMAVQPSNPSDESTIEGIVGADETATPDRPYPEPNTQNLEAVGPCGSSWSASGPTHSTDLQLQQRVASGLYSNQEGSQPSIFPSISNISPVWSGEDMVGISPTNTTARADIAISNWFNLLANDAELSTTQGMYQLNATHGLEYTQTSPGEGAHRSERRVEAQDTAPVIPDQLADQDMRPANSVDTTDADTTLTNERSWYTSEPLTLRVSEVPLFHHFLSHISKWIDLFDCLSHYSTCVPHLALHNVGLLNALLALSARHLSLTTEQGSGRAYDRNDAVQYYYNTLHYVQTAMRYRSYQTSDELLATCLIISAYEMLDGSRRDWERHLKGVFWIQRSQVIHGDSGGLRQATWWAWLCQDVWAAFRERRKPFTFWRPSRRYEAMNHVELASRAVYLMAQVVAYCSQDEIEKGERDIQTRVRRADDLKKMLDKWENSLTLVFSPLPCSEEAELGKAFAPISIKPSSLSVSIQVLHAAHILLSLYQPSFRGFEASRDQERKINFRTSTICGLAITSTDYASSILSSQCIYIAGLNVRDYRQQNEIAELLESCHARSGWPIEPLSVDLRRIWNGSTSDHR